MKFLECFASLIVIDRFYFYHIPFDEIRLPYRMRKSRLTNEYEQQNRNAADCEIA